LTGNCLARAERFVGGFKRVMPVILHAMCSKHGSRAYQTSKHGYRLARFPVSSRVDGLSIQVLNLPKTMSPDNPETLSMEDSHWDETRLEDVFIPSVRVQLGWSDVEAAVECGAIVPAAAHALWATWAAPGASTRLRAEASFAAAALDSRPAELTRFRAAGKAPRTGLLQKLCSPYGLVAAALVGAVLTVLGLLVVT
jgi:hypothetical protein